MIRFATFEDAPQIWDLLMLLHQEQALFSLHPPTLANTLAKAIGDGNCLIAEKDGKVIGSFAWAITETYFSVEQFASDLWLFIHPEHRTGSTALRLKRAMKKAVKDKGLKLLAGALGRNQNGKRLFEKDPDFKPVGIIYAMGC